MIEPVNADNLLEHLVAFADRELDDAQIAALWAYLAAHPDRTDALNWLSTQQRLTAATTRTIGAISADAVLRERIGALVNADAPAMRIAPRRRRFAGVSLAAAAGIAIGLGAAAMLWRSPTAGAAIVPSQLVGDEGRIHAECSRLPADLHEARFAAIDAPLAKLTRADLGGDEAPDLTSADFAFVGAGPCPAAKFNSVHLLYRSMRPDSRAAVSFFVQNDAGQFPAMKLGHVFRVSGPSAPFPTFGWRSGGVVYFLVADDERIAADVMRVLRLDQRDK